MTPRQSDRCLIQGMVMQGSTQHPECAAQTGRWGTGRVENTSGEGLGGARTACITTPSNYAGSTTTDETGNFDIGVADMSARCMCRRLCG